MKEHEEIPEPEEMSCYGRARLLVEKMGGPNIARIYKVRIRIDDVGEDDRLEHAFVIPVAAKDDDRPLNQEEFAYLGLKVKLIRKKGVDVTEEILDTPWSKL